MQVLPWVGVDEVNAVLLYSIKEALEVDGDHLKFNGRIEALSSCRREVIRKGLVVFHVGLIKA